MMFILSFKILKLFNLPFNLLNCQRARYWCQTWQQPGKTVQRCHQNREKNYFLNFLTTKAHELLLSFLFLHFQIYINWQITWIQVATLEKAFSSRTRRTEEPPCLSPNLLDQVVGSEKGEKKVFKKQWFISPGVKCVGLVSRDQVFEATLFNQIQNSGFAFV